MKKNAQKQGSGPMIELKIIPETNIFTISFYQFHKKTYRRLKLKTILPVHLAISKN